MKFLVAIFFVGSQFCFSQNVKTELLNISKAFLENNNIGVISTTKGYSKQNATKAESVDVMEYYTKNKKSYRKYTNTEIIVNDVYKISINTERKFLFVSKIETAKTAKTKTNNSSFDQEFLTALDTTFKLYKEVTVKKITAELNELKFVFKDGMYKEAIVTYDAKSFFVKSYTILINSEFNSETKKMNVNKYEIVYTYVPVEKINSKLFDEKQYIIVSSDRILPSKKYADYTIINNIKKG